MLFDQAIRRATWINDKRAIVYPVLFLVAYAVVVFLWLTASPLLPEHKGVSVSFDFVNVYAAGRSVHEGRPAEAYNKDLHQQREWDLERTGRGPKFKGGRLPWFYPPPFLGVAWLVSFIPYDPALIAYSLTGFLLYLFALHKVAPDKKALAAIAAFPGAYVNLFIGQNGFITTALMAFGLSFLETSPIIAGGFFGLLSYKPQFFILIPLALAAGRYWKAFFASCATALIVAGLSAAAFGLKSWRGFFTSLSYARELVLENPKGDLWASMHTVFSAMRMFGGSVATAYIVQALAAVISIAVLLRLWRQDIPVKIKGAALCATFFLASPYAFNYDEVLLAIPIALLTSEALRTKFFDYEKLLLFFLWLLPGIVRDYGDTFGLPLRPPIVAVTLYLCYLHACRLASAANYTLR